MPGRHRHPIRSVQGVPPDIWDDALHLARIEGTTRNAVIVALLTEWVQVRRAGTAESATSTPAPAPDVGLDGFCRGCQEPPQWCRC